MLWAWGAKSGRLQLPSYFLFGNDTKIPNAPHVRDIRNPTVGPLVTIPITFSRCTRPALLPIARPLLRDFGDPIDRPSSSTSGRQDGGRGHRVSWLPEKSLILSIPRARTRQVRVTRLGDRCDDNGEYEGGRSPSEQDQSSFSNPPDRMLYPRGDSLWSEWTRRERGKERRRKSPPESEGGRERRKDSLIRGRADPRPRFPRDSFALRDLVVFKPERAARSRPWYPPLVLPTSRRMTRE